MAQLDTGGDQGNSKQKKMNARVDFTPMVDMIMLLVTFFMLCTTLLKPQTMEIAMPSDKEDLQDDQRSQVKESEAITVIIDENNAIYYFEGKPDEATLTPTAYGNDGIRKVLLAKNAEAMKHVEALKKEYSFLKEEDRQVINDYFLMLGKGDSFSQKGYFATSKDALEKLYAEAENNCKKYVHLYIKLG